MSGPRARRIRILAATFLAAHLAGAAPARSYVLNYVVGDMRQPAERSGGTACPQRVRQDVSTPGAVSRQWSTSLSSSPVTILTADQTAAGRLDEIEAVIRASFAAWAAVPGGALRAESFAPLVRTATATACAADGVNSVCFNQSDPAFATGVLAFTRVVVADTMGARISPSSAASGFVGQILDADILLRPGDTFARFATPEALPTHPSAYDLQSVVTHEIGHLLGFGHSGVWPAVMFPFVPPPGTFAGSRPTPEAPDAPLADDDRAAARALYPDPADSAHIGSISGRVIPVNPLTLSGQPSGTTGVLGAQVVAVDAATGGVAAAAVAGWACADPGPPVFNGSYRIEGLRTGASYLLYAEPLDGPLTATDAFGAATLCRNPLDSPGWPAHLACIPPAPLTAFSTRIRPAP